MRQYFIFLIICSAITGLACSQTPTNTVTQTEINNTATQTGRNNLSNLQLQVNGETIITEGLTTKDNWQIKFDNAYVNLTNVIASQKNNSQVANNQEINQVLLLSEKTVDLTKNVQPATTILVGESPATPGHYNSLSWQLNKAKTGPISGYSLVLIGKATKDGQTIPFHIEFDQPIAFTCGEYVGEERKGILNANNVANVEITFHFDHLFGDESLPKNDDLNQDALGFSPFFELAQDKQIKLNSQDLKTKFTSENWQKLQNVFLNLGHVGEGHCDGKLLANK